MSFKTSSDLVLKVLDNLGVLPAGQVPGTEDTARVISNLPTVIELLASQEIVYVADIEQIPGAWFQPLSHCVAFYMAEPFGVTGEELEGLKNKNSLAEVQFRVMNRGRPTYQQAAGIYI